MGNLEVKNFFFIFSFSSYISFITDSSELICVQSMDGQLSFFHYDSAMFTCFLPDFLLPGPLGYIPQTDSLVTVNSSHILQVFKCVICKCVFFVHCFLTSSLRYQSLSMAGVTSDEHEEGVGVNTGKKILVSLQMHIGF